MEKAASVMRSQRFGSNSQMVILVLESSILITAAKR